MKTFRWTVPEPNHDFPDDSRILQIPSVRARLRSPLWIFSLVTFGIAFFLLLSKTDGSGIFFFIPFTFSPMLVSLGLGTAASSRSSLGILLLSNVLFMGWFLYVYLNAFYWNPDPQAGIVFLFVGFYSLPVMIPLWIVALGLRHRGSIKESEQVGAGDAEEAV